MKVHVHHVRKWSRSVVTAQNLSQSHEDVQIKAGHVINNVIDYYHVNNIYASEFVMRARVVHVQKRVFNFVNVKRTVNKLHALKQSGNVIKYSLF